MRAKRALAEAARPAELMTTASRRGAAWGCEPSGTGAGGGAWRRESGAGGAMGLRGGPRWLRVGDAAAGDLGRGRGGVFQRNVRAS